MQASCWNAGKRIGFSFICMYILCNKTNKTHTNKKSNWYTKIPSTSSSPNLTSSSTSSSNPSSYWIFMIHHCSSLWLGILHLILSTKIDNFSHKPHATNTFMNFLSDLALMETIWVLHHVLQLQILLPHEWHTKYSEITLLEHEQQ